MKIVRSRCRLDGAAFFSMIAAKRRPADFNFDLLV